MSEIKTLSTINSNLLEIEHQIATLDKSVSSSQIGKNLKSFFLNYIKNERNEKESLKKDKNQLSNEIDSLKEKLNEKEMRINEIIHVMCSLSNTFENKMIGFLAKSVSNYMEGSASAGIDVSNM